MSTTEPGAGSPMPVSAIRKLQQRIPGAELHNFFGLTETISMTHVLKGEDAEARPDSIGRLLPFVEARITYLRASIARKRSTCEC